MTERRNNSPSFSPTWGYDEEDDEPRTRYSPIEALASPLNEPTFESDVVVHVDGQYFVNIESDHDWTTFMTDFQSYYESGSYQRHPVPISLNLEFPFPIDDLTLYETFFGWIHHLQEVHLEIGYRSRWMGQKEVRLLQLLLQCEIDHLDVRFHYRFRSFALDRYFPTEGHQIHHFSLLTSWSPSESKEGHLKTGWTPHNVNRVMNGLRRLDVDQMFVMQQFRRLRNKVPQMQQLDIQMSSDEITELVKHTTFHHVLQRFCQQAIHLQRIHLLLLDIDTVEPDADRLHAYFTSHPLRTFDKCTIKMLAMEFYESPHVSEPVIRELACDLYPSRTELRRRWLNEQEDEQLTTRVNLKDLKCPITRDLFVDPVVAADGFTYERDAIQNYFTSAYARIPNTDPPQWKSPSTKEPMKTTTVYPNRRMKILITMILEGMKPTTEETELYQLPQRMSRWDVRRHHSNRHKRMTVLSRKRRQWKKRT